jgi:AcrR family transcriptional regulator
MARSIKRARSRLALSRDRVLAAALALADEGGLDALTMRRIGDSLGVEAMALYRHVANKDDLVAGIVDLVFAEIFAPPPDVHWKTAMRERAVSMREALSRHPWAVGLMESRPNPGPAYLAHHDAVLGNLRTAGFDVADAAHAYSLLDSYIYGFAMTHTNLPSHPQSPEEHEAVGRQVLEPFAPDAYPYLIEWLTENAMKPGYDYIHEFDYGIEFILDGLERARTTSTSAPAAR